MPDDHEHHHEHHDDGHATVLDLDGEVLGSHLQEVLDWATAGLEPRVVADLGAGTGTGTRLLARRFPEATIVAVDRSEQHLAHLRTQLSASYDAGRLRTVSADLDAGWPAAADGAELVWTASALHHLADPARLLREAHAALAPGGVLVAVEIAELPRFLPAEVGDGLEERLQEVLAAAGWNTHPDWRPVLELAGFSVEHRVLGGRVEPLPASAAAYAQTWLGRVRHGLGDALAEADRDLLDQLLGDGPDGLRHRGDLTVRGSRSVWLARA
ncbi:class I SAM-dependent methyltransferase [Nocardioides sp. W7]|uniref:class I SAM-dependent methyltransferase n=1 Tax=Nocardioides sp. W7 TaxID=2931390 RepID=UPI001FD1A800|nr:class I SAM-dependent methyltransferase [Nocardioides sp. W7]